MSQPLIRLSASAIVHRPDDSRFLIIEELINNRLVLDVPGGTWESGETLLETSIREAAEEASIQFVPQHYLGCFITEYTNTQGKRVCSVRNAFSGLVGNHATQVQRDPSTKAIYWMTLEEVISNTSHLRSSATLRCLRAFAGGKLLPLDYCDQVTDV